MNGKSEITNVRRRVISTAREPGFVKENRAFETWIWVELSRITSFGDIKRNLAGIHLSHPGTAGGRLAQGWLIFIGLNPRNFPLAVPALQMGEQSLREMVFL